MITHINYSFFNKYIDHPNVDIDKIDLLIDFAISHQKHEYLPCMFGAKLKFMPGAKL